MNYTKSQLEFSIQLTENILKQTAKKYRRKFKPVYYQEKSSRLWILSRDGEKVKAEPCPTIHNPIMNIVIFGNMKRGIKAEILLEKGYARANEIIGCWDIEDLKDLGLSEKVANAFYKEEWSTGLYEAIRAIFQEASKL